MPLLLGSWLLLLMGVVQVQGIERVVLAGNAQVERVDVSTRSITVRAETGAIFTVYVDPNLKVFDTLRKGDRVRIRVLESVVVAVTNARPTIVTDTTAQARKNSDGSSEVLQQLKGDVVELTYTRERAVELEKR